MAILKFHYNGNLKIKKILSNNNLINNSRYTVNHLALLSYCTAVFHFTYSPKF